MFTILFYILLFMIFGKILFFAIKLSWGITKILFSVVLLPLVLIGMAVMGSLTMAFILLLIIGIVSLFTSK